MVAGPGHYATPPQHLATPGLTALRSHLIIGQAVFHPGGRLQRQRLPPRQFNVHVAIGPNLAEIASAKGRSSGCMALRKAKTSSPPSRMGRKPPPSSSNQESA